MYSVLVAWLVLNQMALTPDSVALPDLSGPCAPLVQQNRRAVLVNEGEPGIWFQHDVAACMLGRLETLPAYADRVRLLEFKLELMSDRDRLLRRSLALAEQSNERAVQALRVSELARAQAQYRSNVWYRRPTLWFSIGVMASAIVIGLVAIRVQ